MQRQIEEVFLEAVGVPPESRGPILDRRCQGNPALRREVQSLLSIHEQATGVLDVPQPLTMGVMKQISGLLRTDDAQLPQDGRIGAYHVQRVIGSGGMGVVYLAEQERPRRTVALKVIRRGLATSSLLRRFEHEAEVLGRLHHPGIAQIYEAGVADYGSGPQPYIAMEYVDGRQLLEYAEMNRLGTRERLALVAKICDAVQHAHQRGVIHRDLKPANILVQPEETTVQTMPKSETRSHLVVAGVGQPKVLDFGVARIADGRPQATTMRTSVGQLIGTLAYMSPEQFGSDTSDIDTRTDVYSLGVVMFQLLTGKLPYDVSNRALPEAVRMIKDDEPTRLSTINRTFRGDLDTIVYKALEKDRNRRYQSAAELGADIQRYLLDEPIAAKRDSSMYLLSKRLRRYRGVMIAASIALIALIALAANSLMSAWEYKAIAAAEKLATDAERIARQQASDLNLQLHNELTVSNIERGRLEAATGNVVLAEDIIWPIYLKNPASAHARWALLELYARSPCIWSRNVGGRIFSAEFSPDRTLLSAVLRTGSIVILRTTDAEPVRTIEGLPRGANRAIFMSNDRLLVSHTTGHLTVVELQTSGERLSPVGEGPAHAGAILALTMSPNGRYFATGGRDRIIRIWNAQTFELLSAQPGHGGDILTLAFSPDSLQLASGANEIGPDAKIRVWSVPTCVLAEEFGSNETSISSLAFTPDDTELLVGFGTRMFGMLDIESGSLRLPPSGFAGNVSAFDMSPSGKRLLVCGGPTPSVYVMPDATQSMPLAQHTAHVIAGRWVTNSAIVTVSSDGTVKSWSPQRSRGVSGLGGFNSWCFGSAYTPDGSLLAAGSGDGTVALADGMTRKRVRTFQLGERIRTRAVTFTHDGRTLLTGSDDGLIRFIDPATGEVTRTLATSPPKQEIFALALHPDGRTLAASCADRSVRIWNLESDSLLHHITGLHFRSEGAAYTPDGKTLIVSGPQNGVALYKTSDYSLDRLLEGSGQVWSVAVSPDGSKLAASTWNNNVDLWETGTWKRLPSLPGHRGLLSTIAFSPDGAYLASGGDDATVRLWDMASLRNLITFQTAHGEATGLSFHPSGRYLTTACQNLMVITWDLAANEDCLIGNHAYQRGRIRTPDSDAPTPPAQ